MNIDIKPIGNDTEENRMFNKCFVSPIYEEFVEIGKDKFVMPDGYNEKRALEYLDYEVQDADIFFVNHLKTGSSWLQELVWLINNDLDFDAVSTLGLKRFILLERMTMMNPDKIAKVIPLIYDFMVQFSKDQEELKGIRYIKTHLHWSLLPRQIQDGTKTPKIFVAMRNPQDVCISYYHYTRMILRYTGTFEEFCELFMAGKVPWGPYLKQVLSCWEQRHRPNVCIVQYREMKENFPAAIRKVASFLNKTLTDDDINKLADFLSVENMRTNKSINREDHLEFFFKQLNMIVERTPFVRSGIEGGYKTVMSPEMIKKFEKWVEENITVKGLVF